MSDPARGVGLFTSIQRLLATAIEIAQVRLELLGTELEFEKRRIINGILWGSIALLLIGVGLVLVCGFVILLFAEGYRLAAVGVMSLLFLGGGTLVMLEARRRLQNRESMFEVSAQELAKDRADLTASSAP